MTVTDTGRSQAPAGLDGSGGGRTPAGPGGYGLVGMRERLQLAGGELVIEPGGGDGFVVRGRVPGGAQHRAEEAGR